MENNKKNPEVKTLHGELDGKEESNPSTYEQLEFQNTKLRQDLTQAIKEIQILETYRKLYNLQLHVISAITQTINIHQTSLEALGSMSTSRNYKEQSK